VAAAPDLGLDPASIPPPELSRPKQKEHGDWSTNLALILAPKIGRPPREVAEAILRQLDGQDLITRAEVAGPGFINLFLGRAWLHGVLAQSLEQGPGYGRAEPGRGRAQVEFVSANPTGPLHVGHARNAALGDALANVLAAAGYTVEREYYFNDTGGQMDRFGASVEARYLQRFGHQAEIPEDGYFGDYIDDLAGQLQSSAGDKYLKLPPEERRRQIQADAAGRVLEWIRRTLDRFGVRFDVYLHEAELERKGEIADAVQKLRDAGFAYDAEGAVWFRSTAFGDDKDRPIIRSDGRHTYFAADCAYLIDKFRRGFDHLVYVWGADHHGDVARVRGAAQALGFDPDRVEILIYQFVSFERAGEPLKMSKRAGTFVTMDDLIDEVGTDAARFTLLSYSTDSPMTFDFEVVKRQTLDNPVYYVQYAHARIASLVRRAEREGVKLQRWTKVNFEELTQEAELDLLRRLSEFPEVVGLAAAGRAAHRLTRYAEQVAADFHRFYTECRVITEDASVTQARLWLSVATKQVIASTLGLLGVSAPESMERLDGDEA